ncbi:MAG: hypothetical protein AAF267_00585 [Deinococcota bacterium]
MTYTAVKHELRTRGSQSLARLSHQVISDIRHVFNDDADLVRYVRAVNICTRALTIVEHAKLDMKWRAVNVRDWVLMLEYGSSDPDLAVQSYWASLLATSVIRRFGVDHSPLHVDITSALTLAGMDGLSYLHKSCPEHTTTSQPTTPVEASQFCADLNMSVDGCKTVLRQLYELDLVEGVVDDDSQTVRQLVLTPEGAQLAKRLHFGQAQLTEESIMPPPVVQELSDPQHDELT